MGTNTHIHIGPYMVVNGNNKIEQELLVKTCSNKECKIHKENQEVKKNFCSECGSPIENKTYNEIKNITSYELLNDNEEFEDLLSCVSDGYKTNYQIQTFISNKHSPFSKGRKFDDWTYGEIDLSSVNQKEEIDWFKNEFKNIITLFKSTFAGKSVEIKWGLIQWFA